MIEFLNMNDVFINMNDEFITMNEFKNMNEWIQKWIKYYKVIYKVINHSSGTPLYPT